MIKLTSLPQFTRNALRFREIVFVLAKYGLANWIKEKDPEFIKDLFRNAKGENLHALSPELRVRMALAELGPTFIKLGQILSTRSDLVGPGMAEELEQLQSNTPADPPDVVRATILDELGKSVDEIFAEFDDEAIASASIGQAHRAVLRDGSPVVVKVQHPGIEKVMAQDMDIIEALIDLAVKYDEELRLYQPKVAIAQFRRTLLRELDFRREGRNLEEFARNFKDRGGVKIPGYYPELSAKRVLTMEFIEGAPLSDIAALKERNEDTAELARQGAKIFLDMIFTDGFYHADPHPGNLLVMRDGRMGLLDCGMVGRLDRETREEIEDLLMAAVSRDLTRLMDAVLRIGAPPQNLDRAALRSELHEFIGEYVGQSLQSFDVSGALTSMTGIIRRHRIVLPSEISMLLKVVVMLEGTSRKLNRNFSLVELLEPYFAESLLRRRSPLNLVRKMQRAYQDWDRLIEILPREAAEILQLIRDGKFDVHLEHRRLDPVVNRLIYGILVAALFLGSCMVLAGKIPPLIGGVSLFGIGGCIYALFLGARLLRAIKKSGDLK